MKEENIDFLINNGIIPIEVCSRIDCKLYSQSEINPIIANYGCYTAPQKERVSIADVVGYNGKDNRFANVYESLDGFFDSEGNTQYTTRSLGMLGYTANNVMKELGETFEDKPVTLVETGEGSYILHGDGRHRFTVLRCLYLSEAAKAGGDPQKLRELSKKYQIPAKVIGVDYDKTYCKYLLRKVKPENDEYDILDIETEYDENYNHTGNVVVKYANGQRESLNDELLLKLTKERVLEDKTFCSRNSTILQKAYDRFPSFRDFIDDRFDGIIPLQKKENKGVDFDD